MSEIIFRVIEIYATRNGKKPFRLWLDSLKDLRGVTKITASLDRLIFGNFKNCQNIANGVSELKINFGPGYRVYFGQEAQRNIILLCGGNKQSQKKDIEKAKKYWEDYKCRKQINSLFLIKTT